MRSCNKNNGVSKVALELIVEVQVRNERQKANVVGIKSSELNHLKTTCNSREVIKNDTNGPNCVDETFVRSKFSCTTGLHILTSHTDFTY